MHLVFALVFNAKAKVKSTAVSTKTLAKALETLASDFQRRVNQTKAYAKSIATTDEPKWAREDQFGGRLDRHINKCEELLTQEGFI